MRPAPALVQGARTGAGVLVLNDGHCGVDLAERDRWCASTSMRAPRRGRSERGPAPKS